MMKYQIDTSEMNAAIQAALAAGAIAENYFRSDISAETKSNDTIVTIADRECEAEILKILNRHFPSSSFAAEESGITGTSPEMIWHVDPIDGTRNFANGIPMYAISIALEKNNQIQVGVVYNPSTKSLFYAAKDKGAFLNDTKLSVSDYPAKQAMITITGSPEDKDQDIVRELLHHMRRNVVRSVRDFSCCALDLCYLASGGTEAAIVFGLSPYDFAAGLLIAIESGAEVTNITGQPYKFPNNYFIASNREFHQDLVAGIENFKSNT